jgi:hypothetical protein
MFDRPHPVMVVEANVGTDGFMFIGQEAMVPHAVVVQPKVPSTLLD